MKSWSLDPKEEEKKAVKKAEKKAEVPGDLPKDAASASKEENLAAAKLQAKIRGDAARQELAEAKKEEKKAEVPGDLPKDAASASKEENLAAARLQAKIRGNAARQEQADQHDAATKMQAVHRGKKDRKELEEQKQAATKMQTIQRGNIARKEAAKKKKEAVMTPAELKEKRQKEAKKKREEMDAKKKKQAEDKIAKKMNLKPTSENTQAAIKLQNMQRGKAARSDLERMKKEGLNAEELKEVKELERKLAEAEKREEQTSPSSPSTSSNMKPKRPTKLAEKRVDENDGRQYTKAQFQKKYGGISEWNASMTQAQMLGQDAPRATKKKRRASPKKPAVGASIEQRSKMMQLASGIELKALPFTTPKTMQDAIKMLDRYRERELDLLEFQQLQAEKMSTLRKKAEKTVGSLSQEIEMMSSDLSDMRNQVAQETKSRKKEERNRRTAEADAERLRRELRGERDELRLAVAKETELQIERDRLDAVLSKVGAGALDDLEARLQASEERRWQAEAEIEKLRTELNWQTNGRMDERLAVSQLEEELNNVRQAKRRVEVKRMQLEESLEQCMASLRSKKRECTDYRKRLDAMLQQKGTGVLKGRFQGGSPRIRGAGAGAGVMEDPIKPTQRGGRGRKGRGPLLPPTGMKKGSTNSNGQDLASLRRKITTLRKRVGGSGDGRFGM